MANTTSSIGVALLCAFLTLGLNDQETENGLPLPTRQVLELSVRIYTSSKWMTPHTSGRDTSPWTHFGRKKEAASSTKLNTSCIISCSLQRSTASLPLLQMSTWTKSKYYYPLIMKSDSWRLAPCQQEEQMELFQPYAWHIDPGHTHTHTSTLVSVNLLADVLIPPDPPSGMDQPMRSG
jgi:hypothetical protein